MELNKKTVKSILLIITGAIIIYWAITHLAQVFAFLGNVIGLLSPFIIGACIAFVVNILMVKLEALWDKVFKKFKKQRFKLKRMMCIVLSGVIVALAIFLMLFMLLPELAETFRSIVDQLPGFFNKVTALWNELTAMLEHYSITLPDLGLNTDAIIKKIMDILPETGTMFIDTTVTMTSNLVGFVVDLVLGMVFSIYVLAQKEQLCAGARKTVYALFKQRTADAITELMSLVARTFTNFVTGQLTEALIIGCLCCVGMLIFNFPYALPVSVLIGFTALIPMFGAFIGTAVGAFLILLQSPIKALWFIVFILVLQQLEGNLIYPKVVGKSVGLPGIWVLVAVTVGGSAFGIVGMLIGVPVCSVLYTLFVRYVNIKAEKKNAAKSPAPPKGNI